jgi:hypothetical protein
MNLNAATTVHQADPMGTPVDYALQALRRDWHRVFGAEIRESGKPAANQIRLAYAHDLREEGFRLSNGAGEGHLLIEGADDLGVVFGIYHLCEHILGVDPYEYWTDFVYLQREQLAVAPFMYVAPRPKVRFRGWFMNDEDCLRGWDGTGHITLRVGERVFETLLRAGYNMAIPYSLAVATSPVVQLAADMGLWITHHHCEPLGAQMFRDAFPGETALMPEETPKFVNLYRAAIEANRGRKMVWGVGFRGQGDRRFWDDDPRYDTPESRGRLITEMIQLQQLMVREMIPGEHRFCHNIYAESAELYQGGHIQLDDDVIRIWGDNGFGAMRRRRTQREPEAHVLALPTGADCQRSNGVYYHVSFHDLEVSSTLLPLVEPELIRDEFQGAFDAGNMDYLTLNVSNIHPHVFNIELIGKIVTMPHDQERIPDDTVAAHYRAFNEKHFPEHEAEVEGLMRRYYAAPFQYGSYRDDRAGVQVFHHSLRRFLGGLVSGDFDLAKHAYISDPPETAEETALWHLERVEGMLPTLEALQRDVHALGDRMDELDASYYADTVEAHTDVYTYSRKGMVHGLKGGLAFMAKEWLAAFLGLSQAKWAMQAAWDTLTVCEHDKWVGFFRGEGRTNLRLTVRELDALQGVARIWCQRQGGGTRWAGPLLGPENYNRLYWGDLDNDALAWAILAWREGVDELGVEE